MNQVWPIQELKEHYNDFNGDASLAHLDESSVSGNLRPLIPYAEFWGTSDDFVREDDWLAGPAAINPPFSAA